MDDITKLTNEAFERYFNALSVLGYIKYLDVYSLIVLSLLEELLTEDLSIYINESDYRTLSRVKQCLIDSNCLIASPAYIKLENLCISNI